MSKKSYSVYKKDNDYYTYYSMDYENPVIEICNGLFIVTDVKNKEIYKLDEILLWSIPDNTKHNYALEVQAEKHIEQVYFFKKPNVIFFDENTHVIINNYCKNTAFINISKIKELIIWEIKE